MADSDIYQKLVTLPDDKKKEVGNFVDFLKMKAANEKATVPVKAGVAQGLIQIKEDFDEPLDEFKESLF